MTALLSVKELRERLGLSASTFHRYRRRGDFRDLLAAKPVGVRKYSRIKVEKRYPVEVVHG